MYCSKSFFVMTSFCLSSGVDPADPMRFFPRLPDCATGDGFEIFLEADFLDDWLKFFLILLRRASFGFLVLGESFLTGFAAGFFYGAAFLMVAVIFDSLVLLSRIRVFFIVNF